LRHPSVSRVWHEGQRSADAVWSADQTVL